MFSDENKASSLAKFLNTFDYAIIDTSSLMEDSFPNFMDTLVNAQDYLSEDLHIIVYQPCLEELKKHSRDKSNDSKRIAAKRAQKILKSIKRKKIIEFEKKKKGQNFADNVIYVSVSELRIHNRILVVTQDKNLAEDLGKLNLLGSQLGRRLSTYKIGEVGDLIVNKGLKFASKGKPEHQSKPINASPARNEQKSNKSEGIKEDFTDLIAQDKRLKANLNNENYPLDKKKADLEEYISALKTIPNEKKSSLYLSVGENRANQALVDLKQGNQKPNKPIKMEDPKPPVKKEITKQIELKNLSKAGETKPLVKAPEKKLYYGEGRNVDFALGMAGDHEGLLFRDPSVPYFKGVHGPIDVTSDDKTAIVSKLLEKQEGDIYYKGAMFRVAHSEKGFRVYIDLNPQPTYQVAKSDPKVAPKKEAESGKAEKPVEKAPVPGKVLPKIKQPKPTFEEKQEATQPVVGASLIVAIPDEKTKRKIERKVKAEPTADLKVAEKPATAKSKAKKAEEKKPKAEEKPAVSAKKPVKKAEKTVKKQEKPAEKAESSPAPKKAKTPAVKKEEAKPQKAVTKPAKKPAKELSKEAKTNDQPKKNEPAKKAAKSSLDVAKKAEARLQSVLSNGNYPKESKLKDLQVQLKLVQSLKPEEASSLKYNADSLKGMISLLG